MATEVKRGCGWDWAPKTFISAAGGAGEVKAEGGTPITTPNRASEIESPDLPLRSGQRLFIIMSSKRGRKRNDNLPPNRARDVQRAFRARRAAHLLALEQRVSELEAENAKLRKMVGWPPDDRPPLGKGPTGKDKPSAMDTTTGKSSSRTSSLSPSAMASSSRTMHVIDPDAWEQALTMNDHDHPADVGPASEPSYQLPPMATPISTKPIYPSYGTAGLSSSLPSSASRSPIPPSTSAMYMNSPANYSHSSNERHLTGSYSSPSFVGRGGEMRVGSPRQHYAYHQPAYQNHDPTMHPQSPPPPSTPPAHSHSHSHLQQRDVVTPFAHRRSLNEQYSMSQGLHLPNPAQLHPQQNARPPDVHRMHDASEQHQHAYRMAYGPDGRINSMP
ncbi:hypothetical protein LshimejAT787_0803890 [Lyophyllum shimeji]|uniref:BZIP domain-containing protein n=1 Tax=Lyophyllum shimeji TaxID=47721 RepID=A0A9P3PS18_LYOSH|nr:hypothetical protein LshimejAT787_0803890 [Lyophyllum shimeji]